MKYLIILFVIILFIVTIFLIVMEVRTKCDYASICMVILTLGLVFTAIYGFYITNNATRLQTSMDFCLNTYQMFQSEEYVERENIIRDGLCERGENYCAIEEIDNDTLRNAVYEYCEIMNGIGVLVMEHMINTETVISYLGANTLMSYRLIKPYLDRTRQNRVAKIPEQLPDDEKEMIKRAQLMTFAHFELLVMEMKRQAPKLLEDFRNRLDDANKR